MCLTVSYIVGLALIIVGFYVIWITCCKCLLIRNNATYTEFNDVEDGNNDANVYDNVEVNNGEREEQLNNEQRDSRDGGISENNNGFEPNLVEENIGIPPRRHQWNKKKKPKLKPSKRQIRELS